uniref:histidine kinase n=1 Tax=Solibacter usitatus (strain Ellin6076) TaxID=234267 RepID=Q023I0_SOLUE
MATGQLHRNQEKRRILQIAHQVSATIGNDFFRAMAKHLARELEADHVLVGEFCAGRTERIAILASMAGGDSEHIECPLEGTASAQIATGKAVLCRSVAQHRFPADRALATLKAQAFVGIPLMTSAGGVCGVLMAVYRKPAATLSVAKSLLEVFAPRAAAELERKQENDRLRESEQRYQAFVMLNADAMWRIELEQPIPIDLPEEEQIQQIYRYGYLAECNDAMARQYGLERASQLTGWRVSELSPLTTEGVREAIIQGIRSGYHSTVELSPVDEEGNRRHILRTQWGIVEQGMLQRIWGTTRDVTELKSIERELDASERQMSDLLETLNLLVVMMREDGAIVFCNKHFYQLTGWTAAETKDRIWFELMLLPEDRKLARAAFQAANLQTGAPTHYESALLGPKGECWRVAWDSTCVRDAEQKIVMSANVGRDISEFKMLEAQFRQAQELESLGRLAGGVAHDFNNLLTVITGYSSVLLEKKSPDDPAYPVLCEIRRTAEKGASLTRSLLAFSRRQAPRPEPVDLTALIAVDEPLLLRLLNENIHLVTNLQPSLNFVQADPGQIRQVLFNLVVNARDAMPHGGILTIATSSDGSNVQLVISDTGVGMTEDVRRHLFRPFFRTDEECTAAGLGMATTYRIIRQNGGQIEVDSSPGGGARFRIQLPALP